MDYQGSKLVPQADTRPIDIFDEFRQAKADYDDACRDFAKVQAMRNQIGQRLSELSKKMTEVIQCAMNDPTEDAPKASSNGRW